MKEYSKLIWKKKYFIFFSLILFFVLGYFICSYVVNNTQEYEAYIVYDGEYEELKNKSLIEEALINVIKSSDGSRLITDSQVEALLKDKNLYLEDTNDGFIIHIRAKYLDNVKSRSVKITNNLCANLKGDFSIFYEDTTILTHTFNSYYAGLIALGIGVVVVLIYLAILLKLAKDINENDISDNEAIFKHPFNAKYWILALNKKIRVKDLCVIAVLFAMILVSKTLSMPSGFSNLGINITYIFFAAICWLYGPIMGLTVGFFSDVLGYFISPSPYGFYFPYTISAMLTGFIYGICFYRTKITFTKVFVSRIFVNFFINAFLGSIWWGNISGFTLEQTKIYALFTSVPKQIFYLIPQSIVLFIIFKALGRVFSASNLMDRRICENITII